MSKTLQNKKLRKALVSFLFAGLICGFVGCANPTESEVTDSDRVANVKNALNFESEIIYANFDLPTSSDKSVTVEWSCTVPNVVEIMNSRVYITLPETNTDVIFTATITKNSATDTKDFEVTVYGTSDHEFSDAEKLDLVKAKLSDDFGSTFEAPEVGCRTDIMKLLSDNSVITVLKGTLQETEFEVDKIYSEDEVHFNDKFPLIKHEIFDYTLPLTFELGDNKGDVTLDILVKHFNKIHFIEAGNEVTYSFDNNVLNYHVASKKGSEYFDISAPYTVISTGGIIDGEYIPPKVRFGKSTVMYNGQKISEKEITEVLLKKNMQGLDIELMMEAYNELNEKIQKYLKNPEDPDAQIDFEYFVDHTNFDEEIKTEEEYQGYAEDNYEYYEFESAEAFMNATIDQLVILAQSELEEGIEMFSYLVGESFESWSEIAAKYTAEQIISMLLKSFGFDNMLECLYFDKKECWYGCVGNRINTEISFYVCFNPSKKWYEQDGRYYSVDYDDCFILKGDNTDWIDIEDVMWRSSYNADKTVLTLKCNKKNNQVFKVVYTPNDSDIQIKLIPDSSNDVFTETLEFYFDETELFNMSR